MQKIKFFNSVAASFVLISSSALGGNIASAQQPPVLRPVPLLRAKCVDSGLGSFRPQNLDVSIGRAVYTSKFYLGPGSGSASVTCKILPENSPQPVFQTLNLGFGMPDNDTRSPGVEVRIYLDGKPTETRTVAPARQASASFDVSNVNNVSIEAVCSSSTRYCDRVYFFTANLEQKIVLPPIKK